MYGETITLELGNGLKVDVFIICSPDDPSAYKIRQAEKKLRRSLFEDKYEILGGLDNNKKIDLITTLSKQLALDNFSNGYNRGYERGRSDEYKEAMDAYRERG